MDASEYLDLERDHTVTPSDVEAQRRLCATVPSWLALDWRIIEECVPAGARDKRPFANDTWRAFELDGPNPR